MGLKERYNELKKKYSLPEYQELNRDFDIEEISDESEILLSKIRIKVFEKVDYYAHMLSLSLQPDSDLKDMFEAKYTDDKTREKAFVTFKKLARIIRNSNLVSIDNKESENAEFIKEAYKTWQESKVELKVHFEKLLNYWKTEGDAKSELSYFG